MKHLLTTVVAFVVASVTTVASAQDIKGNAIDGEKKIAMCMGCHGILGFHTGFPEVYRVPKISGQGAKYIVAALTAYQKGERKNPSMRAVAETLNAQDMADVAAYYSAHGVVPGAALAPKADKEPSAAVAALLAKAGCVSCHGDNFSKPIDPSYPKIAGQYPDYVFFALASYKTEGKALIGRSNPIMGAMAKQFSVAELRMLADYVGSLEGELKSMQRLR
ncbi:MAG: c-type cytochrome [Betaproteobacteria bacterium]